MKRWLFIILCLMSPYLPLEVRVKDEDETSSNKMWDRTRTGCRWDDPVIACMLVSLFLTLSTYSFFTSFWASFLPFDRFFFPLFPPLFNSIQFWWKNEEEGYTTMKAPTRIPGFSLSFSSVRIELLVCRTCLNPFSFLLSSPSWYTKSLFPYWTFIWTSDTHSRLLFWAWIWL